VGRLRVSKYCELFGARLPSIEIIQRVYESVGRIVCATVGKYPHQKPMYSEILADYTSLVRAAEHKNAELLGVDVEPAEKVSMP
jgi:hypothetical protein